MRTSTKALTFLTRAAAAVAALLPCIAAPALRAQANPVPAVTGPITADSLNRLLTAVDQAKKEARVFKLGFSVGWRHIVGSQSELLRDAVIEPATGLVRIDEIDRGAAMMSGVLAVFPVAKYSSGCAATRTGCRVGRLWRLGFLANVKLAAFGTDEGGTFNESVEGGIGPAFRFSDDFAVAATVERVFGRRPRNFVVAGQPLFDSPDPATRAPLTAIDRDDDRFFRNDNLTAWSVKFVYFLR